MSEPMTFAEYMRAHRQSALLAASDVAAELNITPQYLGDIEHGRRVPPNRAMVIAWASCVGADPHIAETKALLERAGDYAPVIAALLDVHGQLSAVYADRNRVVQMAAKLAHQSGIPVWLGQDPDEPDWPVVYIELPTGQVSWHIAPDDVLWLDLPYRADALWDGHDTPTKDARVAAWVQPDEFMRTRSSRISVPSAEGEERA